MLSTVILILTLAYWTSRWVASHGAPGASGWNGGGVFRVIGRIAVGRSAALTLVRVGERCLLLGVTEHHITLLKEWDGGEFDAFLNDMPPDNGFLDALRDAMQTRHRRK